MRTSLRSLLCILASAICAPSVFAQNTSVLFVGNSFTHGHNSPVIGYNSDQVADANKNVDPKLTRAKYGGVPGIFKKFTTDFFNH